MSIQAIIGDIIELDEKTAAWAKHLFAKVVQTQPDGSLFATGDVYGHEFFVDANGYKIIPSFHAGLLRGAALVEARRKLWEAKCGSSEAGICAESLEDECGDIVAAITQEAEKDQ